MPGSQQLVSDDPSLISEEWHLVWLDEKGGMTSVHVPVQFRLRHHQRGKKLRSMRKSLECVSAQSSGCFRGHRLYIENEKQASHHTHHSCGSFHAASRILLRGKTTSTNIAPEVKLSNVGEHTGSKTGGQERWNISGHERLDIGGQKSSETVQYDTPDTAEYESSDTCEQDRSETIRGDSSDTSEHKTHKTSKTGGQERLGVGGSKRSKTSGHDQLERGVHELSWSRENTAHGTLSTVFADGRPAASKLVILIRDAYSGWKLKEGEKQPRSCLFPPMVIPGPGALPDFQQLVFSMDNFQMPDSPMAITPANALAGILKIGKTKALQYGLNRMRVPGQSEASHSVQRTNVQLVYGDAGNVIGEGGSLLNHRPAQSHSSKWLFPDEVSATFTSSHVLGNNNVKPPIIPECLCNV